MPVGLYDFLACWKPDYPQTNEQMTPLDHLWSVIPRRKMASHQTERTDLLWYWWSIFIRFPIWDKLDVAYLRPITKSFLKDQRNNCLPVSIKSQVSKLEKKPSSQISTSWTGVMIICILDRKCRLIVNPVWLSGGFDEFWTCEHLSVNGASASIALFDNQSVEAEQGW